MSEPPGVPSTSPITDEQWERVTPNESTFWNWMTMVDLVASPNALPTYENCLLPRVQKE